MNQEEQYMETLWKYDNVDMIDVMETEREELERLSKQLIGRVEQMKRKIEKMQQEKIAVTESVTYLKATSTRKKL